MLKAIVAHDKNLLIGKNNKLPWHIPEDLEHFKNITNEKTVLMGRKTFESILEYLKKPLPNRRNIVITRDQNFSYEGVEVVHSLENLNLEDDIIVIGGTEIYKLALPFISELIITVVHGEYEGDSFFPDYTSEFSIDLSRSKFNIKSKTGIIFDIKYLVRN